MERHACSPCTGRQAGPDCRPRALRRSFLLWCPSRRLARHSFAECPTKESPARPHGSRTRSSGDKPPAGGDQPIRIDAPQGQPNSQPACLCLTDSAQLSLLTILSLCSLSSASCRCRPTRHQQSLSRRSLPRRLA
jgi:hypothetical protein